MLLARPNKIVVLGMMSAWPVAGVAWVTMQYVEGFRRLGYDVYYVEAHGRAAGNFMKTDTDDGAARAADYVGSIMARFGLSDRWAYHDVHESGRCFGLTREQLYALYGSAAMLLNLHGATEPLAEHAATGRLVYLHTDPVEVEIEIEEGNQYTIDFLAAHCAYFTWGLNYAQPDCPLPTSDRFRFKPSPPVVVTDFWQGDAASAALKASGGPFLLSDTFTTVGNWRQHKHIVYKGEVYHWSKHLEFLKFLDLPARSAAYGAKFELALSSTSYTPEDERLLNEHGWAVRDGLTISRDMDTYRRYLAGSRGEFTVAKDENVRLRSGWFSERSAQYLAAGKPVITQDTAFSNAIPTGQGLFAFNTMEQILAAVEAINGDYEEHCRAASELARGYFNYDVVLSRLLGEVGLPTGSAAPVATPGAAAHADGGAEPGGAARDSLALRESYTSHYYLSDCGGFVGFKQSGGKRIEDSRLQAMAMLTAMKSGGRALDLGCGRGELTYYLARRGFEVTAIDYSTSALELAEQRFAGEENLRQRVRFLCDSVCTAPLEGRYDLAIAADVVEHLSDEELECMYGRVARHLKGDGLFLVHTFPNLWFYKYEYRRRRRLAAAAGEYLPPEPRSPYERRMHINEQSPRVLMRSLRRHFEHVLLWFADPDHPGGSLLSHFGKDALRGARDLFAVASHTPLDVEGVRACLLAAPLPALPPGALALRVQDPPQAVRAGALFTVTVEVRNATPHTLKSVPPNPVNIAYHWFEQGTGKLKVWDGDRSALLPPCVDRGTYRARVRAPEEPGVYVLRVTLVQEGVRWFDGEPTALKDDVPVRVEAVPQAAPAPPHQATPTQPAQSAQRMPEPAAGNGNGQSIAGRSASSPATAVPGPAAAGGPGGLPVGKWYPITQFAGDDVFIAGYGKSGNTWFQNLVSAVIYGADPELAPDTLIQELVPDVDYKKSYKRFANPAFFKTHHLPEPQYRRVVYLLRDGRDVMVSYLHHAAANAGRAAGELDFLELVRGDALYPCRWHEHVDAWMTNPYRAQMLLIRYEDLKRDAVSELRRFCSFVGVERDDEFLAAVAAKATFQKMRRKEARSGWDNPAWPKDRPFVRRGEVGSHRDEMPPEVLDLFMRQASATLDRFGYLTGTWAQGK